MLKAVDTRPVMAPTAVFALFDALVSCVELTASALESFDARVVVSFLA